MKFVDSNYNKTTGISIVTLQGKYGEYYTGVAYCHPEEGTKSEIIGCRYAESRAYIDRTKERLREKKQEIKNVENFIKSCEQHNTFDRESPTAKAMFRQLNHLYKQRNELQSLLDFQQDCLKDLFLQQDKITNKINSLSESN